MRIRKINSISEIYKAQSMMPIQKNKASEKDEAIFSTRALEIQNAYKVAKASPDLRTDKVESIKEQIKSGNYNVSSKEISEKIVSQLEVKG